MIEISAFKWVPPFAQGQVRDLRVRWALEAGRPYRARLIDPAVQASDDYRRLQPFGQVPTYRDDRVELFETGAILLHIADDCPALMPEDAQGRGRATCWLIAALNSVEPAIMELAIIDFFAKGEAWAPLRRPSAEAAVAGRLADLAAWLGEREWLEDRFTVGDLMMVTVLRILQHTDLLKPHPTLAAYVARGLARPAFDRALAAQCAPFRENASVA